MSYLVRNRFSHDVAHISNKDQYGNHPKVLGQKGLGNQCRLRPECSGSTLSAVPLVSFGRIRILLNILVQIITANFGCPNLSRCMTKPTKWLCVQQRLRSAWVSAQSDQLSLSAWRDIRPFTYWEHSEDSDQTGRMPRLIWVFAGCTSFCWFCRAAAHL